LLCSLVSLLLLLGPWLRQVFRVRRVLGKPAPELSIAFKDERERLTNNVVELVSTQELGIALGSLSERFINAQIEPASGKLRRGWFQQWHGLSPLNWFVLRFV
jgi:hypothetical protein